MQPEIRQAVRAIVVDKQDHFLLFKCYRDLHRASHFWITPGGGVMAGETDERALRRELSEECGLEDFTIGPQVWCREHVFELPGTSRWLRQQERFYLIRINAHEVDASGWDEFERTFMGDHRWWTIDELEASTDEFAPTRLPVYLRELVEGRTPTEPLDVGV